MDERHHNVPMSKQPSAETATSNTAPSTDMRSAVKALAALAHESRLSVFRLLVQAGPDGCAAGQLAEDLAIAPSSLSFHLKELNNAGLATAEQKGRFVIYSANFDAMNGLLVFLTENCCGGKACIAPIAVCSPNVEPITMRTKE